MPEFENPDHWDAAARHYEKTAHPFTMRYAEAALARVPLTPDSRVLDVAAGTGALALTAARSGAKVLATDFSPGMVARIAAANMPNVETRVMDGQALALDDGSFDAVFSIFGVIMFPDWRKGLAEMARVTPLPLPLPRIPKFELIGSSSGRGAKLWPLGISGHPA